MMARKLVLFVCTHNAGRSVMAEFFFNALARERKFPWVAKSAGTAPKAVVNPVVVAAMRENGFDVSSHAPHLLALDDVDAASHIFTMGCTSGCPITPPEKTKNWPLKDPAGKSIEIVREIRDDVERRVRALVLSLS